MLMQHIALYAKLIGISPQAVPGTAAAAVSGR